jgi:hypothetical protein
MIASATDRAGPTSEAQPASVVPIVACVGGSSGLRGEGSDSSATAAARRSRTSSAAHALPLGEAAMKTCVPGRY